MLLCEIIRSTSISVHGTVIDAYDWVMVPNVYGMSQYLNGVLITTKPYISGSAYVLKMSDHTRGDWCTDRDALYWRFIDKQRDFFASNPRMSVIGRTTAKDGEQTRHPIVVLPKSFRTVAWQVTYLSIAHLLMLRFKNALNSESTRNNPARVNVT